MQRYLGEKIRGSFLRRAVRNNWIMMRATAVFCVVSQAFNLAHVLLWSRVGLGSLNNRIYFGFYLAMLVLAGAFLAVEQLLKARSNPQNYRAQLVLVSLFLLWHVVFGIYDIGRSASVGKIGTVTSLVAFAALLMVEPLYAVVSLTAGYGAMLVFLFSLGDTGSAWNYATIAVVSLVIYMARMHWIRMELLQERELENMNRALEETEEKFLLTNEQYELLLQKGRMVAFEWDIRRGCIRFTREWSEIFGLPQRIENLEEAIRRAAFLQPRQREELLLCIRNARQKLAYQRKDLMLPVKGGEQRWFELQLALQCGEDGEPALGVGLLFDIMDQKSRILKLQKELLMDNFTRTLNKTALESYASRRLQEMGPEERLGMLVLDMDDFKRINDTYGHICGDYVLMQLGERMNALAPEQARVGRLGGDEFGVILDVSAGEQLVRDYAASLLREVPKIQWQGRSLPAACSIGIASCPGGSDFLDLYAAADKALYQAKRQGKNRCCEAPPPPAD